MAITFVGAGAKAASSVNPPVGWLAGHQANDIGIMLVETANEAVDLPSGWSTVPDSPQGGGTSGVDATATRLTMFWKRAASGSEDTVTLSDAGDHGIAQILVFRGCHTDDSVLFSATSGNNTDTTTSTSVTCPAVSTTTDNCFVLGCCAEGIDAGSERFTAWDSPGGLSNFTMLVNTADATLNGGGFSAAGGILPTAGDSGSITMTVGPASIQGRITVALTPAPVVTSTSAAAWARAMTVGGPTVAGHTVTSPTVTPGGAT